MPFSDPIVAGTVLVRDAIQSPDYLPGVSGWSINADGSSEFNGGQFRGAVILGGGKHTLGAAVPAELAAWGTDYTFFDVDIRRYDAASYMWEALAHNNNFGVDQYMRGIYTPASGVQIIDIIDSTGGTLPSIKYGSDFYNTKRLKILYRGTDVMFTGTSTLQVEDPVLSDGTAESWHAFPFAAGPGWSSFGAPFGLVEYRLMPDDMVVIVGVAKAGVTKADATVIGTLPAPYWPNKRHGFPVGANATVAGGRVPTWDVDTNGQVTILGLTAAADVRLGEIRYPRTA